MGFRETVNRNSALVAGVVITAVLAAGYIVVRQITGASDQRRFQKAAYFSSDDGKTWFEDDIKIKPPYQVGGKETVRAYVYECDGKAFVGYLERFSPEMKAASEEFEAAAKAGKVPDFGKLGALRNTGTQVKRPGESTWVAQGSPQGTELMKVKCPSGGVPKLLTP